MLESSYEKSLIKIKQKINHSRHYWIPWLDYHLYPAPVFRLAAHRLIPPATRPPFPLQFSSSPRTARNCTCYRRPWNIRPIEQPPYIWHSHEPMSALCCAVQRHVVSSMMHLYALAWSRSAFWPLRVWPDHWDCDASIASLLGLRFFRHLQRWSNGWTAPIEQFGQFYRNII